MMTALGRAGQAPFYPPRTRLIVAGHEIVASDAFEEAAAFADALGAPVYQQSIIDGAHFPTEPPGLYGRADAEPAGGPQEA